MIVKVYVPSRRTDTDAGRPFMREKDLALSELTQTRPKLIVCKGVEGRRKNQEGGRDRKEEGRKG